MKVTKAALCKLIREELGTVMDGPQPSPTSKRGELQDSLSETIMNALVDVASQDLSEIEPQVQDMVYNMVDELLTSLAELGVLV